MCRIAICDDDVNSAELMKEYIMEADGDYSADIYNNGQALLDSGETYGLYFLDIDMPGINGIDTAKQIRRSDRLARIVYVTSYDDYMSYAFSVHAFDYIVKPFAKERIEKVLQEFKEYRQPEEESVRIRFETTEGMEDIAVADIYHLEYHNHKVYMTAEEKSYVLNGGIKKTAERLEAYGFAMSHKSFVVNLCYVKTIKGYDIYMMDGAVIPLSQKKSPKFRELLGRFQAAHI